jgi:hypothetical protein
MADETDSVIGKHILVGLTYLDHAGAVAKQVQLHGTITHLTEHTMYFDRADGDGEFSIPFNGELGLAAPEAIYTLSSTGEQVSDVDYLASWTVHPNPDGAPGDAG